MTGNRVSDRLVLVYLLLALSRKKWVLRQLSLSVVRGIMSQDVFNFKAVSKELL